jgi:hypothetical protein
VTGIARVRVRVRVRGYYNSLTHLPMTNMTPASTPKYLKPIVSAKYANKKVNKKVRYNA